jgi:hypothetical protein
MTLYGKTIKWFLATAALVITEIRVVLLTPVEDTSWKTVAFDTLLLLACMVCLIYSIRSVAALIRYDARRERELERLIS